MPGLAGHFAFGRLAQIAAADGAAIVPGIGVGQNGFRPIANSVPALSNH